MPDDASDVNEDSTTSGQPTPDLDLQTRLVGSSSSPVVDMGAYEADPSDLCVADINDDCVVNVSDLLAVINAWGPCSSPCSADIAPATPCGSADGTVNTGDLLMIINNWGACPFSNCDGGSGFPHTISECFNTYCAGLEGEDCQKCINACIEAVCQEHPEECD